MSEQPQKYYLTTPIYYVNARPHIGHAYSTLVADVLARRHRILGDETYFLTGTDEHGQKIERSAAAAGVPPQQFADQVSAQFRALWDRMGISYSDYIRTTEPRHKQGVQQLFRTLYEKGFIYLSTYTGAYCVSDEAFVDAPVGTPCPDCGRLLEQVTEENFFFKLSAFQEKLIALIESNDLLITPDSPRNEVLSFIRGGLKDLSISRSSFTWGIPVPDDIQQAAGATQKHVVYVWLDALANYMTALGYGSNDTKLFDKFWPADVHLVGKEITRFHCVYWPAFLMAAGISTPKQVTANGWLLFDNAKMSKSKGNVVRSETILDAFGEHVFAAQFPESSKRDRDLFATDVLRYYLLREIPFGQDGSFSFDALITRYNADLANGYGNLVSRTLNLITQNCESVLPPVPNHIFARMDREAAHYRVSQQGKLQNPIVDDSYVQASLFCATETLEPLWDSCDFSRITEAIMLSVSATDAYISAQAPWKLAKLKDPFNQRQLHDTLYTAAEAIRIITALLHPILPYATARVWAQLGLGDIEQAAANGELLNLQWGGLKPGTKLGLLSPIFPRADKGLAQIMADIEETLTTGNSREAQISFRNDKQDGHQDSTHPAAPPRTSSLPEPSGTLTVGGSAAHSTGPDSTPSHREAPASGIFNTPSAPADTSNEISIDDFVKVELRIAEVKIAERIPKADKLLRLEVDLGALGQRQILSGIAEWYAPEDLLGRRIIVITNLAPRKMRGLESHGMLLAASEEGGKPFLATVPEGVPVGTRLK